MSLKTFADTIDATVRSRGKTYYTRGKVKITQHTAAAIAATVRGSSRYHVDLDLNTGQLVGSCTCPYFADYGTLCKHIWATVLAADARGYLPQNIRELVPADIWYEDDDDLDEFRDEWDDDDSFSALPPPIKPVKKPRIAKRRAPGWQKLLADLGNDRTSYSYRGQWPSDREPLYIIDLPSSLQQQKIVLETFFRERKRDGDWGKPKAVTIERHQIASMPDPLDREVLSMLVGPTTESISYYGSYGVRRFLIDTALVEALLPRVCATGRCLYRLGDENNEICELQWSDTRWEFVASVLPNEKSTHYELTGSLRSASETVPLAAAVLTVPGACIIGDRLGPLDASNAGSWLRLLRQEATVRVPAKQVDTLLNKLFTLPALPMIEFASDLHLQFSAAQPAPKLKISALKQHHYRSNSWLEAVLAFDYGDVAIAEDHPGDVVFQAQERRVIRRDRAAEAAAAALLGQLGCKRQQSYYSESSRQIAPRNLPGVVRTLLAQGWRVEAEGKLYRNPGNIQIDVRSGIDWFELHGEVQFEGQSASLPALLAAVKRGEDTVLLDDGTFGILPEEWLKKYGVLAGLGSAQKDHLRFNRCQVGLLDALLAAQPEVSCDAVFQQARDELKRFAGIEPAQAPAEFVGELRGYQQEGLGWLQFLQRFGFGGCLADDMGLGKTVQVLAMLEQRRHDHATTAPTNGDAKHTAASLVVVPKSLVFNWKQEAARFAPRLRILDHTGADRLRPGDHFADYDIVLTTYGTLRRDALNFKDLVFDYIILDESQAIKNASSESAKAVRLLHGRHRLAMSGTPIENNLGELWSLFEFLNPGMLGAASVFRLGKGAARNPNEETRKLLAMALRPFILRRTKQQVAKDLPEKLEQTLYCDLEGEQRKQYDELRDHYRASLLKIIDRDGMNKSKMHVLEALLRLRQAACHPGLIDKKLTANSSAKLEVLLAQIDSVLKEGHKALVFSQFTSLLAIVRNRLDRDQIVYEYLDGRTRNRQEKVDRFQQDADCKLFLISLKAGGVGLNLTAADYVFLLDPWWNPAVEAQAIDRTHRIGQTRRVFAYRLIARGTVEEKVLQLQETKRELADAIINADNSLVRNLGREDIELLLS